MCSPPVYIDYECMILRNRRSLSSGGRSRRWLERESGHYCASPGPSQPQPQLTRTRRSGHCRLFDSDDSEGLPKEPMKLSSQSKYQVRSSIGFSRVSHSHSSSIFPLWPTAAQRWKRDPRTRLRFARHNHNVASARPSISIKVATNCWGRERTEELNGLSRYAIESSDASPPL